MSAYWNNIIDRFTGLEALEIGGPTQLFYDPTMIPFYHKFKVIDNINSTTFELYDHSRDTENLKRFRNNYDIDATNIDYNLIQQTYDAIISSHTIEHIANPILFLKNIQKLLKPNGLILTILPNKDQFWDRTREYTPIEHMISDYENNIGEDDLTHLYENLNTDHPWKRQYGYEECENIFRRNISIRGLHHHCFNSDITKQLHEYSGFETIHCEVYPHDPLQIVYIGRLKST
jgi:SAM-dependent methyltransferase